MLDLIISHVPNSCLVSIEMFEIQIKCQDKDSVSVCHLPFLINEVLLLNYGN